jgi:NAD(P)-dependent dehydrogenase (short-subunit alcohol dehydrogenase family)
MSNAPHCSMVVLVTGATAGLGYETARLLASLDNNVIAHGPTDDQVEQAVKRMVKAGVDSLRLTTGRSRTSPS